MPQADDQYESKSTHVEQQIDAKHPIPRVKSDGHGEQCIEKTAEFTKQ